ncbi:LysR substrate-binding domain-containing protein [Mycobacterium lentiflavum]|uniref:LysR substrate-binding domain-containing protein n=1 Tax=Mycobacterium lentiflavum TaxID=141349 RepID=A0ABY3UPT7_MYCLN|nr:LysR substrate-binding domain-containing protein [Mycobacterium lentiflavum]ULP41606.1 LysR substrate-binding domain-containing protein [Mycobacterium lentiflavum]
MAESLAEPVRDALSCIDILLQHQGFNPLVDHRTFSVIATDRTIVTFLHPLIMAMYHEAPHVRLEITPPGDDYAERLQGGDADVLIIPWEVFGPHVNYLHEVLYHDRFVCAVDAANTDVGETITLEQFSALPYLATSALGVPSLAEVQLDLLNISRNTQISAGFSLARLLLRGGPLITVMHERLARAINFDNQLRIIEPPMKLQPLTEIMVWTPRTDRDPGNQWLREQLRMLAAEYESKAD